MSPNQIIRALKCLLPSRRAVYIWGGPGTGKSMCVKQAARELELEVIDLRAALLDPVDLRGLPSIKDGVVHWCAPGFLPLAGQDRKPGIIFVDELAQAAPLVQSAFLQGILDHQLGEAVIHPAWSWVAASNRQEDRAGTHRLISPLLNRFIHLDQEVSNDDWQEFALHNNLRVEVRSFLKFRPALLSQFDPSRNERAFCTPRSWHFVSDILPHVEAADTELLLPVVAGTVGQGPAAEFCGFLQIYRDLPDVDQVLANPAAASVPKEPAVLFALSGAIAEKCRAANGDTALLGRAATYAQKMSPEFSVLTMRDLCVLCPQIFRIPAAAQWLTKHREVLGAR
jgi:hypothetical protein